MNVSMIGTEEQRQESNLILGTEEEAILNILTTHSTHCPEKIHSRRRSVFGVFTFRLPRFTLACAI